MWLVRPFDSDNIIELVYIKTRSFEGVTTCFNQRLVFSTIKELGCFKTLILIIG